MAIYKLIADGSFGPDEIEVMKAAYEAALIDVGVSDRDDPITELIAKSIVNVVANWRARPECSNGTRFECPRCSLGLSHRPVSLSLFLCCTPLYPAPRKRTFVGTPNQFSVLLPE